jgi:hypothetical protein
MDAAIAKAIQRLLMDGLQRGQHTVSSSTELVAATVSAAICGGVKQWISMPERSPVKDVVAQLQVLILPMLDAGSRAESPVAVATHPH